MSGEQDDKIVKRAKTCPFCDADAVLTSIIKKVYICTKCGAERETLVSVKKETES